MRTAFGGLLVIALGSMAAAQDTEWESAMLRGIRAEQSANYGEAVALFRQAKALSDHFAATDIRRWASYNRLGVACEEGGIPAEGVRVFHELVSMIRSAEGANNSKYAIALANLASTFITMSEFAPAESLLRTALKIVTHLEPANPREIAMTQSRLGEALLGVHKRDEAQRMIEAALPVLQSSGAEESEVAVTMNNLGIVRRWQHRYDDAIHLLCTSIELVEKRYGVDHPLMLRPLNNLAVVYQQAGRDAEADAAFRRAQAISEKYLPPTHPSHTALLTNYASFLRHTGEKSRAKAMEEEARTLGRDNARAQGVGLTVDVTSFRQR